MWQDSAILFPEVTRHSDELKATFGTCMQDYEAWLIA